MTTVFFTKEVFAGPRLAQMALEQCVKGPGKTDMAHKCLNLAIGPRTTDPGAGCGGCIASPDSNAAFLHRPDAKLFLASRASTSLRSPVYSGVI
jgi:hypothetical protein